MRFNFATLSAIVLFLVALPLTLYAHGPSPIELVAMIDRFCNVCPLVYPELRDNVNRACAEWNEKNRVFLSEIRKDPEYETTIKKAEKEQTVLSQETVATKVLKKDCEDIGISLKQPLGQFLELGYRMDTSPSLYKQPNGTENRSPKQNLRNTSSNLKVVCDGNFLTINGILFEKPYTKTSLNKILGAPSRSFAKASDIDTWDAIGVHAYATRGNNTYSNITISFKPYNYDFFPKDPFSGSLFIKEKYIGWETSPKELESFGFVKDKDLQFLYTLDLGSLRVSMELTKDMRKKIKLVAIHLK
jgi:hypothetical protein